MAKLRLETSPAHISIEQSPQMRAIFSADYSLEDYRTLLVRLLGFYVPLEAAVFDGLPGEIATKIEHRRKSAALANDLHALGEPSGAVSDGSVPAFQTLEERMGALYVTEGATLGGMIIRKHLLSHFGPAVEHAISFYSGYGKNAAGQWRDFGALLGGLFDRADASRQDRVIAGANATFTALEGWLALPRGPLARGVAAARTA